MSLETRYPHSLPAERALLGACLIEATAIDRVVAWLVPEAFYRHAHQLIYRAICRLREAGRTIDLVTVAEVLRADGVLEQAGGPAYLAGLVDGVPRTSSVEEYGRVLAELLVRRRLLQAATRVSALATDQSQPLDRVLDAARETILTVRGPQDEGAVSMAAVAQQSITLLSDLIEGEGRPGLATGIEPLDRLTLGWQPGWLVLLAARPSMGKSALAHQIAREVARRSGPVLIVSAEMSQEEIYLRLLALESGVSSFRLRRGGLAPGEVQAVIQAAERLSDLPMFFLDRPPITTATIRARAQELAATSGLRLVVVDYLQLLAPIDPSQPRVAQLGEISLALKTLARRLEVPVLALSQLSRAPEQRPQKRPQLADLRESGALEQDADLVVLLYRPEHYPELAKPENRGLAELIVAKNRHGPTGLVRLDWEAALMRFAPRMPGRAVADAEEDL